MVLLFKNDNPRSLNQTSIYVSNDSIRVDWMEYWESIREEYSHDDELAYTIKSEDYGKLLTAIKDKYPDYKPNELECKNFWWDEWDTFNDLTKELCMAIKSVFTIDNAYRHIDWLCEDYKIERYDVVFDF